MFLFRTLKRSFCRHVFSIRQHYGTNAKLVNQQTTYIQACATWRKTGSAVMQRSWSPPGGSSRGLFVLCEQRQSGARKERRPMLTCQCHCSPGKMRAHKTHKDKGILITWAGPSLLWRQTHGVLCTTGQTGHHRQRSGRILWNMQC